MALAGSARAAGSARSQEIDGSHGSPGERRGDLIEEYREYVHCVVGAMVQSMGLPAQLFDEFISAGYLGLVEAASRFDQSSGRDFKSFAFLRIRGAVIDSIRECADTSGKAYRYVKALQAASRIREELSPRDDAAPEQLLSEVFDFASKGVLAFRLSLADAEEELSDELGTPTTPEQALKRKRKTRAILNAISALPRKERLVIEEFYFKDRSFTEIAGMQAGLSKSWVSRLHGKALERLKVQLLLDEDADAE